MAGTIVVDRIESDASYASTINVAGQITFSNTVNFGAYSGTAPVAGFYLPTTNNLAFTTTSTERVRINNAGKVGIGTNLPKSELHISGSLSLQQNYSTYLVNSYYDTSWKYIENGMAWGIGNNFGGPSNGVTIAAAAVNASGNDAALTWLPRINIDSSGRVSMPYQPYLHATVANGTTVINFATTHTNVTVPYNSIFTNTGNHFNTSTSTFTCPVAGIYLVYATIQMGQASGTTGVAPNMQVTRSGAAITGSYHFVQSSVGYQKMECTGYVKCAANDTLSISLYTGSAMTGGTTEFNGDSRNVLCIAYIG